MCLIQYTSIQLIYNWANQIEITDLCKGGLGFHEDVGSARTRSQSWYKSNFLFGWELSGFFTLKHQSLPSEAT